MNSDKSNGGKAGLTMAEAYRYFDGQHPRPGTTRSRRTTRATRPAAPRRRRSTRCRRTRCPKGRYACAGPPYNSPVVDGSCGQNYIIFISNGAAQDNNSDNATRFGRRRNCWWPKAATTTTIPISPTGSSESMADEWARFMEQQPVRHHHLHGRRRQDHHRPGAGLDGVAQEHGRASARAVFRRQLRRRRRRNPQAAADHLLRDPGRQQRIRLGQLAGQRQHRGHVPEPDLHRHVPPGYGCAAALVGQPEAVQARHSETGGCGRRTPIP